MLSAKRLNTCAMLVAVLCVSSAGYAQDSGSATPTMQSLSGTTVVSGISGARCQGQLTQANANLQDTENQITQLQTQLQTETTRLQLFAKTVTCLKNHMFVYSSRTGGHSDNSVQAAWDACNVVALNTAASSIQIPDPTGPGGTLSVLPDPVSSPPAPSIPDPTGQGGTLSVLSDPVSSPPAPTGDSGGTFGDINN